MKNQHLGTLYIVATPIGNLQDITYRAVEVLKNVALIAVEDTRHSMFLLRQYDVKTPLISLHDHNERDRVAKLTAQLEKGESIALISDAGTPLISDPGYVLVKEIRAKGIPVIPIPGSCAAIAALSAAGLPTDKFVFEGFLPNKSKQRKDHLNSLLHESRTIIFYESPHRILDTLSDMRDVFGGERTAVIARELTKMFETIHSGTLNELYEFVSLDENQRRGEIVLLLAGIKEDDKLDEVNRILPLLLESLPVKQATEITAKLTGARKNEIYDLALRYKKV